jgi:opacity protein-like surface antigen
MLKKIAAAATLAAALAFSAAAPAVLSAGSIADTQVVSAGGTGNWPDPMSKKTKDKSTDSETTYTTYTGNWPDPM